MNNKLLLIFILFGSFFSCGQTLPFYYEQNLPLYGKPSSVAEYYYEYHTQVKAHYYDHTMEYDSYGRITKHIKSNKDLLNPDSIPLTFRDIIDLRAITITYSFKYDHKNRLSRFSRHQYQEEVGIYQQDEEWKYDNYDMLIEHNFWEIRGADTVLKNPSYNRIVFRDAFERVKKIEKYTYSFADKSLQLSEITEFSYKQDVDTIVFYRFFNGAKFLIEKRFQFTFLKYDPLNTDAVIYASYTSADGDGQVAKHSLLYDGLNRMTSWLSTTVGNDTLTKTEWLYEPFKTTENTHSYSLEVYFDETGYEKYREEFEGGSSLAVPSEKNTRDVRNGEIKNALLEVWDPVTYFYRKDTEYIYKYDRLTGIDPSSELQREIKVYPNPSAGTFYIDKLYGIQKLELVSSDGKSTLLPIASTLTLNAPRGIYILCAFFEDASVQRTKIIIE